MRYNFYTIFDKGFLAKGLVLYDSVVRHCPGPFRYFILCLDDLTHDILRDMKLPSVTLLTLNDIEDDELREAKKTRTVEEYSWTLKPSVAAYIFQHYPDTETVMYLDGDLYFYSSLEPIYKEFEGYSVLLFPHRMPEGKREKEEEVGKYNAGMIMFRNDAKAKTCLAWWRRECNAWCYREAAPGKLGDQKYLDFFEGQFEGIHVLQHEGVDIAPWNIKNYRSNVKRTDAGIFLDGHKLINFHFSSLSLYYPYSALLPNGPENSYGYTRPSLEKKLIYDEYVRKVYDAVERIRTAYPGFSAGMLPRPPWHQQIMEMAMPLARGAARKVLGPTLRSRIKKYAMQQQTQQHAKRILVTGGLGFIGSNFVQLALDRGYHVINIDKKTYAARTDLHFDENQNYEFIHQDICDLRELPGSISHVVNFAAESHVDNSLESNGNFVRSNVHGVYNLLELLKQHDPATRPVLIQISTDEVYGDRMEGSSIETDRLKPSNPYSATKAAADQLVFGWGRSYGIKYRICRSSNNYGYGQYAEKLIPRTIKSAYKGIKMTVQGDGSYQREWTQVEDNCRGILLVMEQGHDGEIYNISTGEVRSNLWVVQTILRAVGKPDGFFVFVANRPGQDLRYSVDSHKIRQLGWQPQYTLATYLPIYLKRCDEGRLLLESKKPLLKRIARKLKP
ncbi:MAG: GDP-mannose 4,6-dehydratase [Patescibacteria group bacterium]